MDDRYEGFIHRELCLQAGRAHRGLAHRNWGERQGREGRRLPGIMSGGNVRIRRLRRGLYLFDPGSAAMVRGAGSPSARQGCDRLAKNQQ